MKKKKSYLEILREQVPKYRTGQYLHGAECICPVCGKHFWSGDDWAFVLFHTRGLDKTGDIRACSYTCLKKGRSDFEEHTRAVYARRARIFFRNIQTGERLNIAALAKRLGVSDQTVRRAYKLHTPLRDNWIPENR